IAGALRAAAAVEDFGLASAQGALAHADAGSALPARAVAVASPAEQPATPAPAIAPPAGLPPAAPADSGTAERGEKRTPAHDTAQGEGLGHAPPPRLAEPTPTPHTRPRTRQPEVFIPPRPPDDPGPEGSADDLSLGGFRASGAKA